MIFDQAEQTYRLLMERWLDLAIAFERLQNVPDTGLEQKELDDLELQSRGRSECAVEHLPENDFVDRIANEMVDEVIAHLVEDEAALRTIQYTFNRLNPPDLPQVLDCQTRLDELGNTIKDQNNTFREYKSRASFRANMAGLKDSVGDIAAYPVLTSDADLLPQSSGGMGGSFPNSGSLQRIVDGAVRDALGRLPRTSDTRSFLAALNQSFVANEIESRIEYVWIPRAYSGQTELGGGVSGAQASLYARAHKAYEDIAPILNGLYSLTPAEDVELVHASHSIVHEEICQIVTEFALEGGPRAARIDGLFSSLLGPELEGALGVDALDLYEGCHLQMLQDDYGLERENINSLEEEANVTQFIVLVDYIQSLRRSWMDFRQTWYGKDLGTRLVLLSRALTVTAESVQEVCTAMDSVFVGAAERQVTFFRDQYGKNMLVADLLSWITLFTSEEAPNIIHEGGKRGVDAIKPTAKTLSMLLHSLIQKSLYDPSMPDGLRHPRVIHPLRELEGYLKRVVEIAENTYAPMLSAH